MHPIHIYNDFKDNVIYSVQSGDGIHSFLRKRRLFRDDLGVDQHGKLQVDNRCIGRN